MSEKLSRYVVTLHFSGPVPEEFDGNANNIPAALRFCPADVILDTIDDRFQSIGLDSQPIEYMADDASPLKMNFRIATILDPENLRSVIQQNAADAIRGYQINNMPAPLVEHVIVSLDNLIQGGQNSPKNSPAVTYH